MATILEIALSNALMAAVLALIAFAVSKLWRRPAVAHALWVLVLLKLVTPSLFRVEIPWSMTTLEVQPDEVLATSAPGTLVATTDEAAAGTAAVPVFPELDPVLSSAATIVTNESVDDPLWPEPAVAPTLDWSMILGSAPAGLLTLWITGSLAWFALLVYRIALFQRLLRFATPASADVQEHTEGLARRLGLARAPTLWMVPGAVSPMLWGILGRPRLLIPIDLWKDLDWSQRGALLTHELAHFRRRDHWVRGLELLVTGLFWWHPVVWWARHELREAEEQCCDAWVLWALPAAKQSYAQALVETMDFLAGAAAPLPAPASGLGHVHQLKRRLTMILRGNSPRALTWASGLCVLGLAALLLPVWPTWAQPQPPKDQPPMERRGEGPSRREGEARRGEGGDRDRELDRAREEIQRLREQLRRAEERLESLSNRRGDDPKPREGGDRPGLRGGAGGAGGSDRRPELPGGGDGRKPEGGAPGAGGGFGRGAPGGFGGGGLGGGPGGGFGGMPGMPGGGDLERRLSEVEKKLDRLLKEIEGLRPGVGVPPGGPGPRGPGAGPGAPPAPPAIRDGDRRSPPAPPPPPRDGERKREDDRGDGVRR